MRNIARETQIRKPFGKTDSSIGFQPAVWISSRRSIAPREPVKGADREVEIRTYHSWAHFRELIPAWEGILRENGALSIFSTPEWLGSWWDAFGTNRQLIALTFWDADGELLGLAPLYLDESRLSPFNKKKCLRLVGDGSGDSDNLDLILRPGFEVVCCQAFLRWLVDHPRWDVCCLNTMPENSMGARVLSRQLTASKWTLSHTASPNGALSLPSSWESYVESLACDFRPLVTRYPHRLTKRFQERVYRCEDASQLSTGLDVLFSLHQKRWNQAGEPGSFASLERRDFYERMAKAFLKKGWLEFWFLELNSMVVAAQFCFRYGKTVYLLQEGFDPDFAAHKVGYALRATMLQHFIQSGATRYDFLGGINAHKQNWGARPGSYLNLSFAAPWSLGSFYITFDQLATWGKEWLRQHLPSAAWNVLHRVKLSVTCGTGETPSNINAVPTSNT